MYRLAFYIERCNPGRSKDNSLFSGSIAEKLKQGGFTRSSPAGDEKAAIRFFKNIQRILKVFA